MRKVKCPTCNTMNSKEDTEKIGNRYYCIPCADKKKEEVERNSDGWDELFDYICELYDVDRPTGQMFAQLRRFRAEPYNFTNRGMYLTLQYFYETLGNEVKDDTGLGIIEYEYDNAKKHHIDILKIRKSVEEFEQEEEIQEVKLVPSLWAKQKTKQLSFNNIQREGSVNIDETTFD